MQTLRLRGFWRRLLIACLFAGATAGAGAAAAVDPATEPAANDGLGVALQATLRNHPAVAGKQAEVQASRYAADEVRSQRYPTLSAQAQQYTQGGPSSVSGEDLSNPAVLSVRQPIWAFGRINNNIEAANAEESTERADLLRVGRRLLEDTAVAYAGVLRGQQHVGIARENVAQHLELEEQIRRRVEGQLASSADARLAATRLAQARASLESAISDWEIAEEELIALTQVAVGANQAVPSRLLELPEAPALVARAMDESAEIRLKEQQLEQADAEVDRAKTSFMPTIYLQADKFYDQPTLRDDSQVSVVFEAELDGLGFAARGRTREAAASRTAATQDLAAARVELKREIERLQRSRRLQRELMELQSQSLSDLESLLASYQRQYDSGTKSWLDVMNIQRELFEQRRQLVDAENGWVIYSLRLQARTGGLDGLGGLQDPGDD